MKESFQSLSRRLLIRLVLMLLVLSFLLTVLLSTLDYLSERRRVNIEIDRVLQSSKFPAYQSVFNLDPQAARSVAEGLFVFPWITEVWILDEEESTLINITRDINEVDVWTLRGIHDPGERQVVLYSPDGNQMAGEMRIGVNYDIAMAGFYRRLIWQSALLLVELALIGLCLFFLVDRYITAPLRRLSQTIQMINPLNPGGMRLPSEIERRQDEIGVFTLATNQLLLQTEFHLAQRRNVERKLEHSQRMMEQRVNEQTAQLRAAVRVASLREQQHTLEWLPICMQMGLSLRSVIGHLQDTQRLQSGKADDETGALIKVAQRVLNMVHDMEDISRLERGIHVFEVVQYEARELFEQIINAQVTDAAVEGYRVCLNYLDQPMQKYNGDTRRLTRVIRSLIELCAEHDEEQLITVEYMNLDVKARNAYMLHFKMANPNVKALQVQDWLSSRSEKTMPEEDVIPLVAGLLMTRRLVEMMGGDLTVQKQGQVLVMAMTVPYEQAAYSADQVLLHQVDRAGAAVDLRSSEHVTRQGVSKDKGEANDSEAGSSEAGLRVLLVDDSEDNQRLLTFLLKREGMQVEVCGDGEQAVARIMDNTADGMRYDVILMDIQMPVMDGKQAMQELRSKAYNGPIIALTANTDTRLVNEYKDAGANGYASKPVDIEKLKKEIHRVMSTGHG